MAAARGNSLHEFTDTEMRWLDNFGATLRALRKRTGQTRPQLAATSGISSSYIRDLELGARRPRPDKLERLSWGLRPAPAEVKAHGRVRWPGDWALREQYYADEFAFREEIRRALFEAIGPVLAPSAAEHRRLKEVLDGGRAA